VLKALDADLDFSGEKNTSSSPAAISAQDGPDNEWPLQPEGMELAHPL